MKLEDITKVFRAVVYRLFLFLAVYPQYNGISVFKGFL